MTQSFFESTEGLFSPTQSNPPFSWRTDIKKLNSEHRLAGEMGSDNLGSDLAWHDQWVMTSIMANSYFLFVCAIVTAQGLRHRFSLNKTEEGSPRRHSKFLNLFSVVRWDAVINKRISQKCALQLHKACLRFPNSGCSAHGGLNGTCYSEAECRKRQGLVAGQLLFMSSKSFLLKWSLW